MAVSMPVLAFEGKSLCGLSGLSSGILILAVSMPGFSLGEEELGGGGDPSSLSGLSNGILINSNCNVLTGLAAQVTVSPKLFMMKVRYRSSVQFKMVSTWSEKPTCATPRLSEVSPTLHLKRFQCSFD